MPYPWYELVEGAQLQQGDILRNCLTPILPRRVDDPQANDQEPVPEPVDEVDRVVVLSQSCDLADGDIRRVMVCPLYELEDFVRSGSASKDVQKNRKANLRRGRLTAHHLLNACELDPYEAPHLVADFGDAFSIPVEYATALAGNGQRIRLLPPYREQLSQMFARFYMRVGLPIDVIDFP